VQLVDLGITLHHLVGEVATAMQHGLHRHSDRFLNKRRHPARNRADVLEFLLEMAADHQPNLPVM
jgi:hypothetical protein